MQIVVTAKKIKDEWRGALIVDNEFQDALVQSNLADMIAEVIDHTVAAITQNSYSVTISVNIQPMPMRATE
jgi:hypothetical protein